jgi:hypothetical protein
MPRAILTTLLAAIALNAGAQTDPRITSWLTEHSGQYARMYQTYADEQAGNSVTVWNNNTYAQSQPAYAGVQTVAYSSDFVYVRTTGLALGHVMGPWYNNTGPGGAEEVFQNWPEALFNDFRIPRTPTIPAQRTPFPPGAIGLMIDGTIIFSSSDTFSWDNSEDGTGGGSDTGPGAQGGGMGDGIWSHDAFITEGNTFDKSNSHAAGNQLHYHAVPMILRHLLGDSVQAVQQPNGEYLYSENPNGRHSPILGWMNDGYPLYGPYGFSDPTDTNSTVRRMVTGFSARNGSNGTYDITANGRNRLPEWAVRFQGVGPALTVNQQGPTHAQIPVPYYMEDYDFKGDLAGFSQYNGTGTFDEGQHYDLNELNVRFCVTPEFPAGTWAYFTCISSSGNPVFPYNVSVQYYGDPSLGGPVQTITENVTTNFAGGPDAPLTVDRPNGSGGTVTLTWSAAEGGSYTVEATDDLKNPSWSSVGGSVAPTMNRGSITDTSGVSTRFYRVSRTALAAHDTVGGTAGTGGTGAAPTIGTVNPNTGTEGTTVSVSFTLSGAMLPPAAATPTAVTIGAVSGSSVAYDGTAVTASFTLPAGTTGAQNVSITFPAPAGQPALVITAAGGFMINAAAGGGTAPTISLVNPNSGTEGATVSVSITLTGDNLPPANAVPTSVTIGSVTGTAATYDGSVATASFALPAGTTGAQNVTVTFPPAQGEAQALVVTSTGGFTINASGGAMGSPPAISLVNPNSGTEGATVSVSITLTGDNLPPANAPLPTVTVGGVAGTNVTRNNNTITATVAIPANATTGVQEIIVAFDPPPGQPMGATYNLTGVFTVN